MKKKLFNRLEKLENIIERNYELAGDLSHNLKNKHKINSLNKEREILNKKENLNRKIEIGILGRVKAGKSSLLNALLFDGKNVLPKSATPMTASLTIIEYGPEVNAEVEFFSQEDIELIKEEANQYKKIIDNKIESKSLKLRKKAQDKNKDMSDIEIENQAKSSAKKEMGKEYFRLTSSYQQYQDMNKSPISASDLDKSNILKADSLYELNELLLEYVGAEGKYMPFAKSVKISLPNERLKQMKLIDTPGLNDPVQSREQRTNELIKECDVIFIISPAGQFMSREDTDLMDRITMKEGIQELYVIASKIDNELYGNQMQKNNGSLPKVLNGVVREITPHLRNTLISLKKSNPEVGGVFDELSNNANNRVIYSSGICNTLKNSLENKDTWDEAIQHVWGLLTSNYPDYFTENDLKLSYANLELLGNIKAVDEKIEEVRIKKDEIISNEIKYYLDKKHESFKQYHHELLENINKEKELIKESNIEDLKQKIKNIKSIHDKVSHYVDEKYDEIIHEFHTKDKWKIANNFQGAFNKFDTEFQNSKDSIVEDKEKGGFLPLLGRKLGIGGYEKKQVKTIRTNAVNQAIRNYKREIKNSLKQSLESEIEKLKISIPKEIINVIRKHIDDGEIEDYVLRKSIRKEVDKIQPMNKIHLDKSNPLSSWQGIVKGLDVEDYIADVQRYTTSLRDKIEKDFINWIEKTYHNMEQNNLSKILFKHYKEEIDLLKKQVENKQIELLKYDKLIKELENINA